MNKEFVPYEQALALKELGFNKHCFAKYYQQDGNTPFIQIGESEIEEAESAGDDVTFECDAPLYQQAFRWFREKYFIHHEIGRDFDTWDYELYDFKSGNKHIPTGFKTFNTYEEAELACLIKLIEIVKNK
jgi:hypothetical protein